MIPIKDEKYMLNCQGPYDYNRYMGEGIYTGDTKDYEIDVISYGFKIPITKETCFFLEEEIVAEFDNGLIKEPKEIQDQIDSESPYCKTCNSCGDTSCCAPINCDAVKCKYGKINLKDYECFQNQWEIMHNALVAIKNNEKPSLEEVNYYGAFIFSEKELAENALNAVDKEWHKLYSKDQHD
jgi:hypothetical protein